MDATESLIGVLPPMVAAYGVTSIMSNMMPSNGKGGLFGGQANAAPVVGNGVKQISQKAAIKLFGAKKALLAKKGVDVTNEDGDTLYYDNGFYLA